MHWDIWRQGVFFFSLYEIWIWTHSFANDLTVDHEELQIVNFSVVLSFCLVKEKLIQFNNNKGHCL